MQLSVSHYENARQARKQKKKKKKKKKKEKEDPPDLSNYSQTWELRPPKGLGVSGPIFQVVSFARFGSKNFNMELNTCPCASHDISYSDRWFSRVSGGVAKRSLQTLLQTR